MKVLRKAFKRPLNEVVTEFVSSADEDHAIFEADIAGSLGHVEMLKKSGLITSAQASTLVQGLQEIKQLFNDGEFRLAVDHEDVHMNVEIKLHELIGDDAKLLHTARSRNDQVALDLRIFVMDQAGAIQALISDVQTALVELANKNIDAVMPGYTHLQRAQPLLFSHVMHAFIEQLSRDKSRFADCVKRTSVSPLGAGALVGSGLPIMPEVTAAHLKFDQLFSNSVDAVSDRDFIAEFLFAASLTSVHLSQMAETFIIWCTKEFSFVQFPDDLTTTSSLMPQKKNPDPMELVRGKTGSVVGELVSVLTTLKGLPVGYNRDLQETKPGLVRTAQQLINCLSVMKFAVIGLEVNQQTMLDACTDPELYATDLVEYLVEKGVKFRAAHEAVAGIVQFARDNKLNLSQLALVEYKNFAQECEDDLYAVFDAQQSVQRKVSHGGTAPKQVSAALKRSQLDIQL